MGYRDVGESLDTGIGPPRVPRERRYQQFLDATVDLITTTGIDTVTMEAVALRTGVSKALVYRHFPNRSSLLVALFDREIEELDSRVQGALHSGRTFEDAMRRSIHAWFAHMASRGHVIGVLIQASVYDEQLATRQADRQLAIDEFYGDLFASEYGLSPEIGRDAAAILLSGIVGASARWLEAGSRPGRARVEETYIDLVLNGLAALGAAVPD